MKAKKGFTLLELILTITVLSIITASLGMALLGTLTSWADGRNRQNLHEYESQARTALLAMVRDIRMSHAVTFVDNSAGGLAIAGDALVLRARTHDGDAREIRYFFDNSMVDASGRFYLQRTVLDAANVPDPNWPVRYVPARLRSILVEAITDPIGSTLNNCTHLRIELRPHDAATGAQNFFETTVSLRRLPPE
jgi:prepilin-type N-terminal cleavage/methylation domain-containing protein